MSAPAAPPTAVAAPPALELTDLEVAYRVRGIWRPVLRGVTLQIADGEAYGLVGESGCGKSTVARLIVGLYPPSEGRIAYAAVDLPQPDSPTSPYASPSAICNVTPRSTGRQIPRTR